MALRFAVSETSTRFAWTIIGNLDKEISMSAYGCRKPYRAALAFLGAVVLLSGCGGGSDGSGSGGGGGNPPPSPPPPRASVQIGCYSASYQSYAPNAIGSGILSSSGNATFDFRFGQEVAIQYTFWAGVPATVYLFDEGPGVINALALPQKVILLGRNLSIDVIVSTGTDLPIAGVLAHEWGHQVQFAFGWMNQQAPTVRLTELEADAFSGYYMGLAKGWAGPQLNTYFANLFKSGDYQFNHPSHHGTPNDRVAAGGLGMSVAAQSIRTGIRYSYLQLHSMFTSGIKSTILDESLVSKSADLAVEKALAGIDMVFLRAVASGTESVEKLEMPQVSDVYRQTLWPYASGTGG